MAIYNVFMGTAYVRDAQFLRTDGLTDEEIEVAMMDSDSEHWCDMAPVPYVATLMADSEDEACREAGKRYRYDPRILYATGVSFEEQSVEEAWAQWCCDEVVEELNSLTSDSFQARVRPAGGDIIKRLAE